MNLPGCIIGTNYVKGAGRGNGNVATAVFGEDGEDIGNGV